MVSRVLVSDAMIEAAYLCGVDILAGGRTRSAGIAALVRDLDTKERTARAYVDCYIAMRTGRLSKLTVSAKGLRFLLEKIASEGLPHLAVALGVLQAHIDYLESLWASNGKFTRELGMRAVCDEFTAAVRSQAVPHPSIEAFEAEVLAKLKLTPKERAQELQSASGKPGSYIVFTRVFHRSPSVVAEVLLRAGGVCEGCRKPAPFARADGRPYLEVHHRVRLADDGLDTVANAIALCPNCHRESHYGA